jgi:hypothetical protein
MKTHDFDPPQCFHGLETRIFTIKGTGHFAGLTVAKCDQLKAESCHYWGAVFFQSSQEYFGR